MVATSSQLGQTFSKNPLSCKMRVRAKHKSTYPLILTPPCADRNYSIGMGASQQLSAVPICIQIITIKTLNHLIDAILLSNNNILPFNYFDAQFTTTGSRHEIYSRVLLIGKHSMVLLLTMFNKTQLKDICLIFNYIKKEI